MGVVSASLNWIIHSVAMAPSKRRAKGKKPPPFRTDAFRDITRPCR